MQYRRDIDGLRAIAILLVLAYHGGLPFFKSGFVGVDVFFVISGFLITSIIHDSLNNNRFSFIEFYNRRLWRLQPVFVCVLVFTTVLTLLFFLPDDLNLFIRSARKTTLFASNSYFNSNTTGYFSSDNHLLPLLHTWSLSIEWQCYFILPLVMYGLHRTLSKRQVILTVYALTVVCFVFSLHRAQTLPTQTYYLFSSRFFEFLIGACVALMPLNRLQINQYILSIVGVLALITIGYVANLNDILLGYPNWYAFSICIATGLLIALGQHYPQHFLVRILSFKPLVFIGTLSFSLYLWHWVVLSVLRYQGVVETPGVLFLTFGFIVILSYLSWRFIEKPSKRFNQIQFRYTFVCLLLLPILFTHVSSYAIKSHFGYPQRFNQELADIYAKLAESNSVRRSKCIDRDNFNECKMGSTNPQSKTALMIGDSVSNHYWGFMDTLGQELGLSIIAQAQSNCIALPGIHLFDWSSFKNDIYKDCSDKAKNYFRMIKDNHYDYVIIGQLWERYLSANIINHRGDKRTLDLSKQRIKHALIKAIDVINESGARPVLLQATAELKGNYRDCFLKQIKLYPNYSSEQCDFIIETTENSQWLDKLFSEMKIKYPNLTLINPRDVQCKNNTCKAEVNKIPVYRDTVHITDYASYQFGKLYLQHYGNPLG